MIDLAKYVGKFKNRPVKTTALWLSKNSAKFIGYSIASIIDAVDQVIVIDNDSTDKTQEVVFALKSPKVQYTKSDPDKYHMDWNIRYALSHASGQAVIFLDDDYIWDNNNANRIQGCLLEGVKQKKKGLLCDAYNVALKPGYYTTKKRTPDFLFHFKEDPVICGGSFYTDTNHLAHKSEAGRFARGKQRVDLKEEDYLNCGLVFTHWKFLKDTKEEFITKYGLFLKVSQEAAAEEWERLISLPTQVFPHPIPEVLYDYRDLFVPLGGFDVYEWVKRK